MGLTYLPRWWRTFALWVSRTCRAGGGPLHCGSHVPAALEADRCIVGLTYLPRWWRTVALWVSRTCRAGGGPLHCGSHVPAALEADRCIVGREAAVAHQVVGDVHGGRRPAPRQTDGGLAHRHRLDAARRRHQQRHRRLCRRTSRHGVKQTRSRCVVR